MNATDLNSKADFLRSIARMYYNLGLNQNQIAQRFQIGRSSVARFLAEARECGIVEIKIADDSDATRDTEMEIALRNRYKLRDAIVARNTNSQNYFAESAAYIQSILPYSGIIAIGGGTTLHSIGTYLKTSTMYSGLQCIQSTGIHSEAVPSTAVVQTWASNLGAQPVYLSVPGIVASPEMRSLLLQDSMFLNGLEIMRQADLCFFGIGSISQLLSASRSNPLVMAHEQKIQQECVGDIYFHFYNEKGDFCLPEVSNFVLGLSQMDFLRIPIRVASAVGKAKVEAIRAALVGRLANILLTDSNTAMYLLNDDIP